MKRRWLVLLAVVPAVALVLAALAHLPHATSSRPAPVVAAPGVDLAVTVAGGRIDPERSSVPGGRLVHLLVRNAGDDTIDLRLAGYEDRVHLTAIAPGETRPFSFAADRPGEDFAWLVDARPTGRLAVTGSHLIEGHR